MKIGVIDSGVGGLSVLWQLVQDLPQAEFVYLADQAHLPYSQRTPQEIRQYMQDNVAWVVAQGCEAIVVACNTATVFALPELREQWPKVPMVGTVPPVKVATDTLPLGSTVAVLVTEATARSSRLAELLAEHGQNHDFHVVGSTELVTLVEAQDWTAIEALLPQLLPPSLALAGIVLGCTHFPFFLPELTQLLPNTPVFTPAPGVSRQLQRVLKLEQASPSDAVIFPAITFHSTAGASLEPFWQLTQARCPLELNNTSDEKHLESSEKTAYTTDNTEGVL